MTSDVKMPINLQECIDDLKSTLEDKEIIKSTDEEEWVATVHHGLGRWLRNNWKLWDKDSVLARYFHNLGIYHADDMSSIILCSFWRHLNYHPIKLEEQIEGYQKFWKDQGVDIRKETLGV